MGFGINVDCQSQRCRFYVTAATLSLSAFFLPITTTPSYSQVMTLPGKFAVSASGAATYNVPIALPPGVAGMSPTLSFAYTSQGANGLLGIGWSLAGLPSIDRCPKTIAQDAASGGVNYDVNDRFCLDGQRLVVTNGAYGADGAEYRTEIDSYSKIVSHGTAGTGPAWFELHTKSGQTMEFGNTTDARILAQGKTTTKSWALNKVADTTSNYFTVTYTNDAANGQFYPTEIDYTGNSSSALAPTNKVQFVYATRPDIIPQYHAGSLSQTTVRLTNVKTYANSTLVGDYRLTYQQSPQSARSELASVTTCSGDNSCLPATSFAWPSSNVTYPATTSISTWGGYSFVTGDWNGSGRAGLFLQGPSAGYASFMYTTDEQGAVVPTGFNPMNWDAASYDLYPGDWNGDGKTDLALIAKPPLGGGFGSPPGATSYFPLSTGTSFSVGGFNPTTWAGYKLVVGDWNGDGKSDFFLYWPGASAEQATGWMFVSNGDGTFTQTGFNPTGWGAYDIYPGDWDGDGKTDLVLVAKVSGQTSFFMRSTGTSFVSTGFNPTTWGGYKLAVGDWNGDGKSDFFLYFSGASEGQYAGWMYLNKGDGTISSTFSSIGWGAYNIYTADWDGDGKTDLALIAKTSGATSFFMKSTGTSFVSTGYSPTTVGGYQLVPADFNGDGVPDVLFNYPASGYASYLSPSSYSPELISSITDGLGATTSITYQPLTHSAVYQKGTGAPSPQVDLQAPIYVVSRVDGANGVGGTYGSTYNYAQARVDLAGRGFLGFGQTSVKDLQTNVVETTTYRQDFPYLGLSSSTTKMLGTLALKQATNSFQFSNTSGGTTIGPSNAPYRVSVSQTVNGGSDLDGTALPTATTNYQYDGFGNATQVVESTPDGFIKTTTNTYSNDSARWLLGRLTRATVTSQAP